MKAYVGVEGSVHEHRFTGTLCSVQRIECVINDKISGLRQRTNNNRVCSMGIVVPKFLCELNPYRFTLFDSSY